MVQLSHPYMTTGKTIALTRWTFVVIKSFAIDLFSTIPSSIGYLGSSATTTSFTVGHHLFYAPKSHPVLSPSVLSKT